MFKARQSVLDRWTYEQQIKIDGGIKVCKDLWDLNKNHVRPQSLINRKNRYRQDFCKRE